MPGKPRLISARGRERWTLPLARAPPVALVAGAPAPAARPSAPRLLAPRLRAAALRELLPRVPVLLAEVPLAEALWPPVEPGGRGCSPSSAWRDSCASPMLTVVPGRRGASSETERPATFTGITPLATLMRTLPRSEMISRCCAATPGAVRRRAQSCALPRVIVPSFKRNRRRVSPSSKIRIAMAAEYAL